MSDQPPEGSANSAIEPPPTKPSARIKALSERIVRWGDKSDFVKLLELAGKFGLVIAAATYLFEIPAQRQAREDALKAKRYQAWALINSAQGSSADGGRLDALQDLNEDGVLLAGAYLANAFLSSIKLPRANLTGANLTRANLSEGTLSKANLSKANLSEANLTKTNLSSADLSEANLSSANLTLLT
jgi:BTB/POZ domain-containing protein KCTD9